MSREAEKLQPIGGGASSRVTVSSEAISEGPAAPSITESVEKSEKYRLSLFILSIFSTMHATNLFESIPTDIPEELVEVLAEGRGQIRIVRLVSQGHSSPDGFWYDQEETEWVVLLQGRAVMSFENPITGVINPVPLKPGDWIEIPAHARHRVESTSPDEPTVWLAVHWS